MVRIMLYHTMSACVFISLSSYDLILAAIRKTKVKERPVLEVRAIDPFPADTWEGQYLGSFLGG